MSRRYIMSRKKGKWFQSLDMFWCAVNCASSGVTVKFYPFGGSSQNVVELHTSCCMAAVSWQKAIKRKETNRVWHMSIINYIINFVTIC